MSNNKWIDISQVLSNDIAVWPGDKRFNYELSYTKEETGSVNIGQLTTSAHTGTHVDAPFHFDNEGKGIDELDIHTYIGTATLIDVTAFARIDANVLKTFDLTGVERLLLKTDNERDETVFPNNFTVIDPNAGAYLRKKGIFLLGTDAPSVDAEQSKTLNAHHSLQKNGVHILENLMLNEVTPGVYKLIALPLKLKKADGSPVRAVIRPLSNNAE